LIEKGFNHKVEMAHIIEELMESTGKEDSLSARELAEKKADVILAGSKNTNKEEIVDAFADIIVFATGSIAKLGYNPEKVMDEVLKEIESRTGKMIDGKFVKDPNPEMYKADFSKAKK
jgi:predicted HAD superfamily Cof-like phosphohydrolase